MRDAILVLNVGSSSIKFALHERANESCPVIGRGGIESVGVRPRLRAKGLPFDDLEALSPDDDVATLVRRLVARLDAPNEHWRIVAAGHRVVHGGREHSAPTLIDDDVLEALALLVPLAPNHQPGNLVGVRAVAAVRPDIPQVACFDTAFHRTQDPIVQRFAIPRELTDEGIIRYGFHGLSYQHVISELPRHAARGADGRVIVAHLGAGASVCAVRERRSVASTMGLTALDGLMMARRPGTLDPGVVLHLLHGKGMTVEEVADLLNNRCGLLGVSGISDDMRDLLASSDVRAREAVDLFVHRAVQTIGGLVATLGGLDLLVFTAGVGENSPAIRARIAAGLEWLGARLDGRANESRETRISAADSTVEMLVIPTDEEGVIARATRALVEHGPGAAPGDGR